MTRSGNKFLIRRFTRKGKSSIATMNLLSPKIWSNYFFSWLRIYETQAVVKIRPEKKKKKKISTVQDLNP